jgi:hypothetical protein
MAFEHFEEPVDKSAQQITSTLQNEAMELQTARKGGASGKPSGGGGSDHSGDPPNHGFPPGKPGWGPPENSHWGWQDQNRWHSGYDSWFFNQDPNYNTWKDQIHSEATKIAGQMDAGNGAAAALELKQDLYAMRGDLYAQDELISQVNQSERKGAGADIHLNAWNPGQGTWENVEVFQSGKPPVYIRPFAASNDQFPDVSKTARHLMDDLNAVDMARFQEDATKAFNDGTLVDALKKLKAETAYNHFDPSQTHTSVAIDALQANVGNSAGDVAFHLVVNTITDSDGKKVTMVTATGSQSSCNCHCDYNYNY